MSRPQECRPVQAHERYGAAADERVLAAEGHLLGGMLLGSVGSDAAEALARLTPADFYQGRHRTLFEACQRVHERRGELDTVVVTDELHRAGQLEAAGGQAYIAELVHATPTAADLCYHVERVAVAARARHAIDVAVRLRADLARADGNLDETIAAAVDALYGTEGAEGGGLWTVEELRDAILARILVGDEPGLPTGYANLDRHYRIDKGLLTVVTGPPGSGKSELVTALSVNLARRAGWRFAVYSPEQAVGRGVHGAKIVHMLLGRRPGNDLFTAGRHEQALAWLGQHYTWLRDLQPRSIDSLLASATLAAHRHGVDGLIIDPWNRVRHERPSWMPETEYIGVMLERLTGWARRHACHVWVVAHPTKPQRYESGPLRGEYRPAGAADVAGSANWFNMGDNILSVWRAKRDVHLGDHRRPRSWVDVHVTKIRFQPDHGTEGTVTLGYDRAAARYTPVVNPLLEPSASTEHERAAQPL